MATSEGVTSVDLGATARQPRSVLIGLQAALWGGYFVGIGLLLTVAMMKAGVVTLHPAVDPLGDPKDVLGLGVAGYILHLPLLFIALLGGAGAAIAAIAGMAMLAFSPANRTRWLYISTALTLACAAVHLTPFGRQVVVWMLD